MHRLFCWLAWPLFAVTIAAAVTVAVVSALYGIVAGFAFATVVAVLGIVACVGAFVMLASAG